MKAKSAILVLIATFFFLQTANSQDFNLFNPSNELYLFSAYDEGANAFRYNPAVLGLGHRLNVTINAFLQNYRGKVNLNEGEILVNSGILGIGMRTTYISEPPYIFNYFTNTYSLALGIGNKKLSVGALFEHISSSKTSTPDYFEDYKFRNRFALGFLFRPKGYLSTSFVARNNRSITEYTLLGINFVTGLAIRPLGSQRLTFMLDFSFTPYINHGFFDNNSFKIGADVNVTKGLYLNANFTQISTGKFKNEYLNFGLKFDFPNFTVRYNNPVFKANYINGGFSPIYNAYVLYENPNPLYKSQGNHISLSYSLERKKSIVPERKKIIEITLSGSLQDYNTEDVFFGILGKGKRSIHEVIADIDYAAADPSVRGMLLKIYPLSTGRFEITASLEELAKSIQRFKAKGKSVTAYLPDFTGPAEYYIATYADDIVLPSESILFYGLSIEVTNYKQFLQKYGIGLETFHAGKYKLTFQGLLDSTTEEGKEVINRMLDIIYEKMMSRVIVARNITLDDYMRDKLSQPISGVEAFRLGLVDKNGWYSEAKDIAEKNSKARSIVKSFNRSEWDTEWGEPDEIAVIGVYGSITTGESEAPPPVKLPLPFVGGRSTGSETVVKQLEDAFSNPKIKAVILRVDSGGGSALASAEINSAIIRLKKKYKKPFVVSMGSVAASGGYYVSTSADKIFADDLTITGSIGVFFAKPNLDSLMNDQRVKVEIFKRGESSDIVSLFKKMNKNEIEIIQGLIDFYYERFVSSISESRNMTQEEVEEVAQGRVWMGSDAFNKKLVDEIGGLYEAIKYAKKKSRLGSRYKLVYYAVPGGNTINEIITSSVIKYLQHNLTELLGFGEDENSLEIKY
ncbi:MAG: signal peptide peptidase SppA [Chlorobi bacterium]|nr:signal peptide peptidase SppA [Chlorobiota bacterium]MCI0715739.1 signal peptide peptidase SppA [Chlorobiota bacterium]